MDYIKKNKFLTAIVAILVLLNIGVIAFVFFVFRPPAPPRGARAQGGSMPFIEERLKLDDAQKAEFRRLREAYFAEMDSTMRGRVRAMRDLFAMLRSENASPDQVREKAGAIGAREAEQSAATFRHFQALRAVCTPEQQKEFDRIVTDAMIQAKGPGFNLPGIPPGAGPPPGEGPGPGGNMPPGGPPPQAEPGDTH